MALLEKQLLVKTSALPDSGMGLFTNKAIPKGTLIVEYKGKKTTWKEVEGEENGYIYFVSNKYVIDARPWKSALARYANDASGLSRTKGVSNNAEYVEENDKVYIKAKKDIPAGEEIFVGYGKDYWNTIRENIRIEKANQKLAKEKELAKAKKEKLKAKAEALKAKKKAKKAKKKK
jgi:SET domain-containing protein